MMIKRRNNTIDILRVIFALLIVALHTDLFLDVHPMLHYFVSQVLSRLGVPFFAASFRTNRT
jgi:peptidoglycan/LPS O-acetylase OafA/YrhL